MEKGGKGYVGDWYGKGKPVHSQQHGGGSAMWRQNIRSLHEMYNPDLTLSLFLEHLSNYAYELCGLQKSYMESHRLYLGRVHQQMRPGLGVQMFQNHSCERRSTVFEFKKYMQNTRAAKPLRKIGWKARSNGYMGWIAQIGIVMGLKMGWIAQSAFPPAGAPEVDFLEWLVESMNAAVLMAAARNLGQPQVAPWRAAGAPPPKAPPGTSQAAEAPAPGQGGQPPAPKAETAVPAQAGQPPAPKAEAAVPAQAGQPPAPKAEAAPAQAGQPPAPKAETAVPAQPGQLSAAPSQAAAPEVAEGGQGGGLWGSWGQNQNWEVQSNLNWEAQSNQNWEARSNQNWQEAQQQEVEEMTWQAWNDLERLDEHMGSIVFLG